ncbi:MAG: type II secretion system F family protein, partial [Acidobacteria bacterium]|nr:type II secretion system F family protein [Acidobacteriota bacterium]
MPEYLYKIATEGGRVLQDAGVATSEKEMRERLLAQGYYVYTVREKTLLRLPFFEKLLKPGRINPDDFVIFNQQFLTLNKSGLPLYRSLELLSHQTQNPALRDLIADVRQRVQGGALVSEAFEAAGMVPPMFIASLRAG